MLTDGLLFGELGAERRRQAVAGVPYKGSHRWDGFGILAEGFGNGGCAAICAFA